MMLPAIAWERMSTWRAFQRGKAILAAHAGRFASSVAMAQLAAGIAILPVVLVMKAEPEAGYPEWVWYVLIVNCGLAWTFSMFVEQLIVAEL